MTPSSSSTPNSTLAPLPAGFIDILNIVCANDRTLGGALPTCTRILLAEAVLLMLRGELMLHVAPLTPDAALWQRAVVVAAADVRVVGRLRSARAVLIRLVLRLGDVLRLRREAIDWVGLLLLRREVMGVGMLLVRHAGVQGVDLLLRSSVGSLPSLLCLPRAGRARLFLTPPCTRVVVPSAIQTRDQNA